MNPLMKKVTMKTGLTDMQIFVWAFQWFEIRMPKPLIAYRYGEYVRTNKLPAFVQDFCLDIICGVIKPQKMLGAMKYEGL